MEIKYVCSLGSLCHTASFLKRNKLKLESYPFDWIFSNYNNVMHCIENKFSIFLDKSYYIKKSTTRCGHSFYNNDMFRHHNPMMNKNDYNYYVRCVDRFNKLLNIKEHKLFIITIVNMSNISEYIKNDIIVFNNKLKTHTDNYTLFVIFNLSEKEQNYHNITINDNINFLEIHTISKSDGIKFCVEKDNVYLDDIIANLYNFNVISQSTY